ncbi:MAG: hypothetical protein U0166_03165 [Acidobacteriota bacterium]
MTTSATSPTAGRRGQLPVRPRDRSDSSRTVPQPKNVVAAKDITGGIRPEWWDLEPANGGVLLELVIVVSGGRGGRMILSAGQNFRYSGAPDNAEDLLFAQCGRHRWQRARRTGAVGSGFGAVQSETIAANIVDIAAFDSNNDGIKDGLVLAVEDPAAMNDQIWYSLTTDRLSRSSSRSTPDHDGTIGKIAVADYDGDGDDDILIGHGDAVSISGLRGTGIAGAPFGDKPIVVAWPLQGSVPVRS